MDLIKSLVDKDIFELQQIAFEYLQTEKNLYKSLTEEYSKRTIEICKLVVDDHEEMIVRALSWALRELAKIDKAPVIKFVNEYENHLHKKVLREVNNKLETGLKN